MNQSKKTENASDNDESNNVLPSQKTIAVIQLTRIGDLIQTYQACKKFKQDYPEFRLVLISRKTFSNGLHFLLKEVFDKVYEIDFRTIFNSKDITMKKALGNFDAHMKELLEENIILSANFSYSKPANYLNSILPSQIKLGPYYGPQGTLLIDDTWSQLANASVLTGNLNPFSLVDLFNLSLGKKTDNKEASEAKAKTTKSITKIVIHPFASTATKRWKIDKWTEVIYKTLKDHKDAKVYLVGSNEEREESFKIINSPYLDSYRSRLINFVGNFKLNEVYDLLKSSHLFIGHDSAIGHLAAVAKVKSVTVSLGEVRIHETTPYGNGNIVISPRKSFSLETEKNFATDVPHQAVNTIVNSIMATGDFQITNENKAFFSTCEVHTTQTSVNNILKLNNLTKHEENLDSVFREFYRISWLFTLFNADEGTSIPYINDDTYNHLHFTLTGIQQLYDLSGLGKKYCRYILEEIASATPSLEKIKTYSTRIDELAQLEKTILTKFKVLRPAIDYHSLSRANSKGDNLVELTHNTYNSYEDMGNMCGILYDLSEKTLVEYKIRKGKGTSVPNEI